MRLSRIWRISRVPARFYDFRGIPVRGEKLLSIGTFDCEIISTSVIAKLENKNKITPPRLSGASWPFYSISNDDFMDTRTFSLSLSLFFYF
jgi:hypothetical protein